jgi:hypothetical protein
MLLFHSFHVATPLFTCCYLDYSSIATSTFLRYYLILFSHCCLVFFMLLLFLLLCCYYLYSSCVATLFFSQFKYILTHQDVVFFAILPLFFSHYCDLVSFIGMVFPLPSLPYVGWSLTLGTLTPKVCSFHFFGFSVFFHSFCVFSY